MCKVYLHQPLRLIAGDRVVASTSLRLCKFHLYDAEGCQKEGCVNLHICKHFMVHDDCVYDMDTCRFGHGFHEVCIMEKHNLTELSIETLRLLFQVTFQ